MRVPQVLFSQIQYGSSAGSQRLTSCQKQVHHHDIAHVCRVQHSNHDIRHWTSLFAVFGPGKQNVVRPYIITVQAQDSPHHATGNAIHYARRGAGRHDKRQNTLLVYGSDIFLAVAIPRQSEQRHPASFRGLPKTIVMMMMIAFITFKSSLVPLFEGL